MTDIKKTVTFTADVSVTDHNGDVTFEAKAGETKELAAPSANRWIRRNKAVEGKLASKAKAAPKKKSASTKTKKETTKQAD